MRYKILNSDGYLTIRAPEVLKETLVIEFDGAREGDVAVINNGDRVFYRDIIDGACSILEELLVEGGIKLSIKSPGRANIVLDKLYVLKDGVTVVYPDEKERDDILNRAREDLAQTITVVEKIRRRISDIYDGVDIL